MAHDMFVVTEHLAGTGKQFATENSFRDMAQVGAYIAKQGATNVGRTYEIRRVDAWYINVEVGGQPDPSNPLYLGTIGPFSNETDAIAYADNHLYGPVYRGLRIQYLVEREPAESMGMIPPIN